MKRGGSFAAPTLRCYCCGKALGAAETFYLVSMSPHGSDRVFIVGADCLPAVKEDAALAIQVRRDS